MPDYDPTTMALVDELCKALDAPKQDEFLAYTDQLRRVQAALMVQVQTSEETPKPEAEQVMRQALGYLDPKSGDQYAEYGEVLRRLLAAVDKELMKWTSGMVQPIGPSGEAVVAQTEPVSGA